MTNTDRFGRLRGTNPYEMNINSLQKLVLEKGWTLLEKLSQVTTFARRTADSIVENPNLPPQVRRVLRNPEVQTIQDEFDSARIYLAKWAMGIAELSEQERNRRNQKTRKLQEVVETDVGEFELVNAEIQNMSNKQKRNHITLIEWKSFFDAESGKLIFSIDEIKERIFHGGFDPEDGVRREAWPFLLNVYKWESNIKNRQLEMSRLRDEYLKLKGAWWDRLTDQLDERKEAERWREQRFRIEKDVHRTDRNFPLFAGEDTPHPDPLSPFSEVGTNVHLEQMKDMLLTYNEFNPELGYVQGMSDLLSPIYAVLQDDAIAFWAFTNFMLRMEHNFLRDQSGMRKQLLTLDNLVQLMDPKLYLHLQSANCTNFFFFFRMLLVWFKREFDWESVLRLWECLWTDYLTSSFHLFVALAILEKHRDVIMEHLKYFDDVLKYVNDLSSTIQVEPTLISAEALFRRFQRTIEIIDKKSNFPQPKLRHRVTASRSQTSKMEVTSTSVGSSSGVAAVASSSSDDHRSSDKAAQKCAVIREVGNDDTQDELPDVVSPLLRELLNRNVECS